jgi:hypothetical protein
MRAVVLIALLLLNIFYFAYSAELASSSYPVLGANPQRNYQINAPVLCPDVSRGKTTVLNTIWTWPPDNFVWTFDDDKQITLDEDGNLHVMGIYGSGEGSLPMFIRLNKNGDQIASYFDEAVVSEYLWWAPLTHLQDKDTWLANNNKSYRLNTTFALDLTINNVVNSYSASSFVPFGSSHLVKANIGTGSSTDPKVQYINLATKVVDESLPGFPLNGWPYLPVMVYKNASAEKVVSVIDYDGQTKISTEDYTRDLLQSAERVFIDSKQVIVIHSSPKLSIVDVESGEILNEYEFYDFNGSSCTWNYPRFSMYHNNKTFAYITTTENLFVDLLSEEVLVENCPFLLQQTVLSIVDNTLLVLNDGNSGSIQVWGYDWDSFDIKLKAILPPEAHPADQNTGLPVVNTGCHMHVIVDNKLYTLAPLPMQNIVPILDCVDEDLVAYFTYHNLEAKEILLPFVVDRNVLLPTNKSAPYSSFRTGHGPRFPLSFNSYVGADTIVTWILEDYKLTFNVTDTKLKCPTTVNIKIRLAASSAFPTGFEEIVRESFVNVTAISDGRVMVVSKKRSVMQLGELETELTVAPDASNTEPSSREVVQYFVENQQEQFQEQISGADGAPANVTVIDITGKAVQNAVEGVYTGPPTVPPTSPAPTPVLEPVTSTQPSLSSASIQIVGPVVVTLATIIMV